jgi:hypothetical protein
MFDGETLGLGYVQKLSRNEQPEQGGFTRSVSSDQTDSIKGFASNWIGEIESHVAELPNSGELEFADAKGHGGELM